MGSVKSSSLISDHSTTNQTPQTREDNKGTKAGNDASIAPTLSDSLATSAVTGKGREKKKTLHHSTNRNNTRNKPNNSNNNQGKDHDANYQKKNFKNTQASNQPLSVEKEKDKGKAGERMPQPPKKTGGTVGS